MAAKVGSDRSTVTKIQEAFDKNYLKYSKYAEGFHTEIL